MTTTKEARLANHMKMLHQSGKIGDVGLMMFGISGTLPDPDAYKRMNNAEKQAIWKPRLTSRLGTEWRENLNQPNAKIPVFDNRYDYTKVNWLKEGF